MSAASTTQRTASRRTVEERFVGEGFGTRSLVVIDDALAPAPAVVSERGTMRRGLPGVYQDSDFAMRFVEALEQVLDPVGATLDGLHRYVDPDFAPVAWLEVLCAWLGVEIDEATTEADQDEREERLRRLVRSGAELGRLRGTRPGLELSLRLRFPDLPLRVEDECAISWPGHGGDPGRARFIVYCDEPIPDEVQVLVARVIEREKPVHASYKLRVKTKRSGG